MTMVLYGYKIRAALAGRVALRPPRLPQVRQHLFALRETHPVVFGPAPAPALVLEYPPEH